LGLAIAKPRVWSFKVLDKLLGIDELRFLWAYERVSKRAFARACGFPLPDELRNLRILSTFGEVVRDYSLAVVATTDLNSADTIADLRECQPDIILGLGTRILSPDVLNTSKIGALNAHSSLLPEYRGSTAEFWQLVFNEPVTGVTIHWMTAQVDEGAIFAHRSWPIPEGADHYRLRTMSLFYRLDLWRQVVDQILRGDIVRIHQDLCSAHTFKRPTLQQEFDFYCRGKCPIAPKPVKLQELPDQVSSHRSCSLRGLL
jgi:folate-dependent phosphoribosylglycinamide formyltransferase PurN